MRARALAVFGIAVDAKYNGKYVRVLYTTSSGKVAYKSVTVKEGKATIKLDSLSTLMVAESAQTAPPPTGDANGASLGLLFIGLSGILLLFARRKHTA